MKQKGFKTDYAKLKQGIYKLGLDLPEQYEVVGNKIIVTGQQILDNPDYGFDPEGIDPKAVYTINQEFSKRICHGTRMWRMYKKFGMSRVHEYAKQVLELEAESATVKQIGGIRLESE